MVRQRRMTALPHVSAACLAAAIALVPATGRAWMPQTHRRIAADALELLPPAQREILRPSAGRLAEGSTFPDTIVVGGEHHLWCPDSPCGDAPDWIAREYARLLADFRERRASDPLALLLAVLVPAGCSSSSSADPLGLDPELDADLGFRLGAIGHYLADLAVPYHTVPYALPWKERHLAFEDEAEARLAELTASFDGRRDDVGADPAGYAIGLAEASRRALPVVDDPRIDHRSARYRDAVDRCYARAVNAVADLWSSILARLAPPAPGGRVRAPVRR